MSDTGCSLPEGTLLGLYGYRPNILVIVGCYSLAALFLIYRLHHNTSTNQFVLIQPNTYLFLSTSLCVVQHYVLFHWPRLMHASALL